LSEVPKEYWTSNNRKPSSLSYNYAQAGVQGVPMNNGFIRQSWHNSLKCSHGKSESPEHRRSKFYVVEWAYENSEDFDSEVTFTNNERADIFFRKWNVAFEITHTESKSRFLSKQYPVPVVPISTSRTREEVRMMLDDLSNTKGGGVGYYLRLWLGKEKI